jgi:hypothetical protein
MSDIFQEVDEALQQEKMLKIWNEYKTTIIAAVVILILSAGLTNIYHAWNKSRDAEETARLLNAVNSSNPAENLKAITGDTRDSHEAIARFVEADIAMENDEQDKAATIYSVIVEDRSTPRDLRDLARILYIQKAEKPELNVLKPLLSNEKSPWIWHARIEGAVIAAQENDFNQAITYLEKFDENAQIPLSLKQRGMELRHVYSLKAQEIKESNEQDDAS